MRLNCASRKPAYGQPLILERRFRIKGTEVLVECFGPATPGPPPNPLSSWRRVALRGIHTLISRQLLMFFEQAGADHDWQDKDAALGSSVQQRGNLGIDHEIRREEVRTDKKHGDASARERIR